MNLGDSRNDRCIVTGLKQNVADAPWIQELPIAGRGRGSRVLFLDSEVVPGAFYVPAFRS